MAGKKISCGNQSAHKIILARKQFECRWYVAYTLCANHEFFYRNMYAQIKQEIMYLLKLVQCLQRILVGTTGFQYFVSRNSCQVGNWQRYTGLIIKYSYFIVNLLASQRIESIKTACYFRSHEAFYYTYLLLGDRNMQVWYLPSMQLGTSPDNFFQRPASI